PTRFKDNTSFYSTSVNIGLSLKSQLEELSKEELIEMVIQREQQLNKPLINQNATSQPNAGYNSLIMDEEQKKRQRRVVRINWDEVYLRHIALKISYLGWNYAGFASQGKASAAIPLSRLNTKNGLRMHLKHRQEFATTSVTRVVATVEDYLFVALENCFLIPDAKEVVSTRCGRTDKGVSGLCQIFTVKVRSKLSKDHVEADPEAVDGEYSYLDMINSFLPPDIRAVGWAPVPKTFNARYDCVGRKYKYLFTVDGVELDVERMSQASRLLVGTHDFRNYPRSIFTRTIFSANIQPADLAYPGAELGTLGSPRLYELVVHGSSFLWHQIRCIMAVLFRVGQGLEEPSIITQLLDVSSQAEKPAYQPASPLPLFLYDAIYEVPFKWQTTGRLNHAALSKVYRQTYVAWHEHLIKAYYYSNLLKTLDKDFGEGGIEYLFKFGRSSKSNYLGAGDEIHKRVYVPLLKGDRGASVEVLNERYRQKRMRAACKNLDTLRPETVHGNSNQIQV
ncbi:pseudouridine synthase deg1, partial [Massospora cicadina]